MRYWNKVDWNNVLNDFIGNKIVEGLDSVNKRELRNTSKSALRKVHQIATTVLERLADVISKGRDVQTMKTEVAKIIIFLEYQAQRGNLDKDLSQALQSKLKDLIKKLDSSNKDEVIAICRGVRTFLDALVAYNYRRLR